MPGDAHGDHAWIHSALQELREAMRDDRKAAEARDARTRDAVDALRTEVHEFREDVNAQFGQVRADNARSAERLAEHDSTLGLLRERTHKLGSEIMAAESRSADRVARAERDWAAGDEARAALGRRMDAAESAQLAHALAHGLSGSAPDPWTANSASLLWHRWRGVAAGLLVLAAILAPVTRAWVQANLGWLVKLLGG